MIQEKKWNWKGLLICHLLIAFLLTTFFIPFTRAYWEAIDLSFFRLINETLRDNRPMQVFWALANHKKADWIEDICIFLFFFSWIRTFPLEERSKKSAQFLFCVLYAAFTILIVNHLVFRNFIEVLRASPTIALENTVRLSKKIPWLSIKDSSPKCFPADHGTTAVLFAACYAYYARGKRAFYGILYSVFLCMPRLITGAHWLSDVIVGSGSIALLFLSWAFCTPLHRYWTERLQKVLYFFRKKQTV